MSLKRFRNYVIDLFTHDFKWHFRFFCALNTSLCGLSRICVFVLSIFPTTLVPFLHETVLLT